MEVAGCQPYEMNKEQRQEKKYEMINSKVCDFEDELRLKLDACDSIA